MRRRRRPRCRSARILRGAARPSAPSSFPVSPAPCGGAWWRSARSAAVIWARTSVYVELTSRTHRDSTPQPSPWSSTPATGQASGVATRPRKTSARAAHQQHHGCPDRGDHTRYRRLPPGWILGTRLDRAHRLAGRRGSRRGHGDGALTGGVGLEALNLLAADRGSRAVVVLNDNTHSYTDRRRHRRASRRAARRRGPCRRGHVHRCRAHLRRPVDGHDLGPSPRL